MAGKEAPFNADRPAAWSVLVEFGDWLAKTQAKGRLALMQLAITSRETEALKALKDILHRLRRASATSETPPDLQLVYYSNIAVGFMRELLTALKEKKIYRWIGPAGDNRALLLEYYVDYLLETINNSEETERVHLDVFSLLRELVERFRALEADKLIQLLDLSTAEPRIVYLDLVCRVIDTTDKILGGYLVLTSNVAKGPNVQLMQELQKARPPDDWLQRRRDAKPGPGDSGNNSNNGSAKPAPKQRQTEEKTALSALNNAWQTVQALRAKIEELVFNVALGVNLEALACASLTLANTLNEIYTHANKLRAAVLEVPAALKAYRLSSEAQVGVLKHMQVTKMPSTLPSATPPRPVPPPSAATSPPPPPPPPAASGAPPPPPPPQGTGTPLKRYKDAKDKLAADRQANSIQVRTALSDITTRATEIYLLHGVRVPLWIRTLQRLLLQDAFSRIASLAAANAMQRKQVCLLLASDGDLPLLRSGTPEEHRRSLELFEKALKEPTIGHFQVSDAQKAVFEKRMKEELVAVTTLYARYDARIAFDAASGALLPYMAVDMKSDLLALVHDKAWAMKVGESDLHSCLHVDPSEVEALSRPDYVLRYRSNDANAVRSFLVSPVAVGRQRQLQAHVQLTLTFVPANLLPPAPTVSGTDETIRILKDAVNREAERLETRWSREFYAFVPIIRHVRVPTTLSIDKKGWEGIKALLGSEAFETQRVYMDRSDSLACAEQRNQWLQVLGLFQKQHERPLVPNVEPVSDDDDDDVPAPDEPVSPPVAATVLEAPVAKMPSEVIAALAAYENLTTQLAAIPALSESPGAVLVYASSVAALARVFIDTVRTLERSGTMPALLRDVQARAKQETFYRGHMEKAVERAYVTVKQAINQLETLSAEGLTRASRGPLNNAEATELSQMALVNRALVTLYEHIDTIIDVFVELEPIIGLLN